MTPIPSAKNKKARLVERITAAVGAGRPLAVETVDFSDPNRPKTCLEVDFPILPVNGIAAIEGNAGKPIYQMSKWWARRRSSVFRSMLLAAAMKAPEDESQAARAVWDAYYANHQTKGALRHLKVSDPFMGGGTTIVEGSRLGMQMFGCDLNPVAWLVTKNEMADVDPDEVRRLLASIAAEAKPMLAPYSACDGPAGERGRWFKRMLEDGDEDEGNPCWKPLEPDFNIFAVPWQERPAYRYEGPEIIYTFWTKHSACQRMGCGHRTPIMTTPVVAIKTLTVGAWTDRECLDCGKIYDVERHAARMAPDSALSVASTEKAFAVMDAQGAYRCPECGRRHEDAKAAQEGQSSNLGKAKSKKVELTLLVHPQWLDGCAARDAEGREYGGSVTDSAEATARWNQVRADRLKLLEVRGALPENVTCPETGATFFTDTRGGTAPKPGRFRCRACGTEQAALEAVEATGKSAQWAVAFIQGYSATRNELGLPYSGRFFAAPDARGINASFEEWDERKRNDLDGLWPTSAIPFGHMTHQRNPLKRHGLIEWWQFFNARQLLTHTSLLKALLSNRESSVITQEAVLGAFQQ